MFARLKPLLLLFMLLDFVPCPVSAGQQVESSVYQALVAANQAQRAGKLIEAEKIYLAAIAQAKEWHDPRLAMALSNLAQLYQRMGQQNKALERMQESLAAAKAAYGSGDYQVGVTLNNLAMLYEMKGQDSKAENCFKQALEVMAKVPGPRSSFKFVIINNLGQFYMRQKRYAESEALLKPAVEELSNSPEMQRMPTLNLMHLLAEVYKREDRPDKAGELEGWILGALQPNPNPVFDPVDKAFQRAQANERAGQFEDAESDYREVIEAWKNAKNDKIRGPYYPGALPAALDALGRLYVTERRNAEAEDLFKQAIALNEQYANSTKLGILRARSLKHPHLIESLYRDEGRLSDMEPIYQSALAVEEKVLGPADAAVGETLVSFGRLYREEGRNGEAVPLYQRALEVQEKNEGESLGLAATLEDFAGLLREVNELDQADAALAWARRIRDRVKSPGGTISPTPLPASSAENGP